MNLPFGTRSLEHTAWVRSATRTDLNDAQQHGVAAAYSGEAWRGEAMAILGNFQIGPDDYRERGWSAFVERAFGSRWVLGASTLGAFADRDRATRAKLHREAHGLFLRGAPLEKLALLAEADVLLRRPEGGELATGWTSMVQVDLEPLQGLHLLATGEALRDARPGVSTGIGGWLSAWWFFAPHADARVDALVRDIPTPAGNVRSTAVLFQLHAFL
ncbi:MAG: hypothetical protein HYV09_26695 [Deltaproteobacteria bacterium]|nr:hypothetical protein [Deltaproteobacteria bacterium]